MVAHSKRGSKETALEALTTPQAREGALREIDSLTETANTRKTNDTIWNTWCSIMSAWGEPPIPLTADKIRKAAAAFRAGGYRSADPYFARAKAEHIRQLDRQLGPATEDALRRYSRAVERGRGPSAQKDAFQVEKIEAKNIPKPSEVEELDSGKPIWPEAMVLMGCWWMLRGIEASAAKIGDLTFHPEKRELSWCLPASKTDVKALGAVRSHTCKCIAPPYAHDWGPLDDDIFDEHDPSQQGHCPYHVARAYVSLLKEVFDTSDAEIFKALPLFPDKDGFAISHSATVAAVRHVARRTGEETSRDIAGSTVERYGEHAMRVSGAQFFARQGYHVYVIQLIGRWGSLAVARYVQLAPLAALTGAPQNTCSQAQVIALIREHSKKQRDGESKDPEAEIRLKAIQEELKDLGDAMTILKAKAEGTKEDSKPRLVQNTLSGKIHSILIGPDLPESATTWCGWRYLGAAHELVGGGSSGNCKRCFRELRAARESGCTDSDSSNSSDTV